jgi:hypothetical protein
MDKLAFVLAGPGVRGPRPPQAPPRAADRRQSLRDPAGELDLPGIAEQAFGERSVVHADGHVGAQHQRLHLLGRGPGRLGGEDAVKQLGGRRVVALGVAEQGRGVESSREPLVGASVCPKLSEIGWPMRSVLPPGSVTRNWRTP